MSRNRRTIFIIASGVVVIIALIWVKYRLQTRLITTRDVFWLFTEGKNKALVMSFDDGNIMDTTIVHILNQYGIKGTFYLNTASLEIQNTIFHKTKVNKRFVTKQMLHSLYDGQEIGGHGINHQRMDQMNDSILLYELKNSKDTLNKYSRSEIKSLAYPYGYYNVETILLARKEGYTNARTISNTFKFDIPVDWMQWHPTCNIKNASEYIPSFLKNHSSLVHRLKILLYHRQETPFSKLKLFTIWGHATDIEDQSDFTWSDFNNLCKSIGDSNNVWCTTATEMSNYIKTINNLIITKYEIYNPENSLYPITFELIDSVYILKPGKTINIHQLTSDTNYQ